MEKKTAEEYQVMLGNRIREYRIGLDLQQAEVAEQAGIASVTVRKIEKGQSITLENLIKILTALHLDHNLEELVPDYTKSPLYGMQHPRKRVKKPYKTGGK